MPGFGFSTLTAMVFPSSSSSKAIKHRDDTRFDNAFDPPGSTDQSSAATLTSGNSQPVTIAPSPSTGVVYYDTSPPPVAYPSNGMSGTSDMAVSDDAFEEQFQMYGNKWLDTIANTVRPLHAPVRFVLKQISKFPLLLAVFPLLLVSITSSPQDMKALAAWYDGLQQPPLVPSGYWMHMIWFGFFVATGYAMYRVYGVLASSGDAYWKLRGVDGLVYAFLATILTAMWTYVASTHNFATIVAFDVLLVSLVGLAMREFREQDQTAGNIYTWYFIWLIYLTALDMGYWYLNDQQYWDKAGVTSV